MDSFLCRIGFDGTSSHAGLRKTLGWQGIQAFGTFIPHPEAMRLHRSPTSSVRPQTSLPGWSSRLTASAKTRPLVLSVAIPMPHVPAAFGGRRHVGHCGKVKASCTPYAGRAANYSLRPGKLAGGVVDR
jgi:hypothetical protein